MTERTNIARLSELYDVYQKRAAHTLVLAKTLHDTAFSTASTIDDNVSALTAAHNAMTVAQQAFLAVHEHLQLGDPEQPFRPALAEPIILPN